MNEKDLMIILNHIYNACNAIETAIQYVEDEEVKYFLVDLYDELFEYTNIIEIYFGLIEEE